MTDPLSSGTDRQRTTDGNDEVAVRIKWHDTAHYEAVRRMPRADFQRLSQKWSEGDSTAIQSLECELMTNHNLVRTEPTDWDDLEIDVFHEVLPEEPQDDIPL